MKGCCHFTGEEQKSEAYRVCAEAYSETALMGCAEKWSTTRGHPELSLT